jgi:hypothetical protein
VTSGQRAHMKCAPTSASVDVGEQFICSRVGVLV